MRFRCAVLRWAPGIVLLGFTTTAWAGAPWQKEWEKNLKTAITDTWKPAKWAQKFVTLRVGGGTPTTISKQTTEAPPTVLVLARDGLRARPYRPQERSRSHERDQPQLNVVVAGEIVRQPIDASSQVWPKGYRVNLLDVDISAPRTLVFGSKADRLLLRVGDVQPQSNGHLYDAVLAFEFPSRGLEGKTTAEVWEILNAFLTTEGEAAERDTQTVRLGQSFDEVKGSLGPPVRIVDLGPKVVYFYKDLKVVFVDGKVSDVQ